MNELISKLLSAADKFILQMHLRQLTVLSKPGFIYSAFRLFTKNREIIKKFKDTGNSR